MLSSLGFWSLVARRFLVLMCVLGDPSKVDLQGVDTPGSKKPKSRRFKVVEKEIGKKLELKRVTEEKKQGRKLPTKAEILERAQESHKVELVKHGLPVISAEEKELEESGMFEEARVDLMRGEKSKVDPQIEAYVHDLNGELEPLGFQSFRSRLLFHVV
jgi:hypothetical protein